MSDNVEFVDGLFVNKPNPKAPSFVKLSLSINRKKLGRWLSNMSDENINVDVKESKNGKLYASVNTFVPKSGKENSPKNYEPRPKKEDDYLDDDPFSDSSFDS